jgi:hypothetical protein
VEKEDKEMRQIGIWMTLLLLITATGCNKESLNTQNTTTTEMQDIEKVEEIVLQEQVNMRADEQSRALPITLQPGRYIVEYENAEPLFFSLYDEQHYRQWISGYYGSSKSTTNTGSNCCASTFRSSFDINMGEGGNYYLIFENRNVKVAQIKVYVTMINKF